MNAPALAADNGRKSRFSRAVGPGRVPRWCRVAHRSTPVRAGGDEPAELSLATEPEPRLRSRPDTRRTGPLVTIRHRRHLTWRSAYGRPHRSRQTGRRRPRPPIQSASTQRRPLGATRDPARPAARPRCCADRAPRIVERAVVRPPPRGAPFHDVHRKAGRRGRRAIRRSPGGPAAAVRSFRAGEPGRRTDRWQCRYQARAAQFIVPTCRPHPDRRFQADRPVEYPQWRSFISRNSGDELSIDCQ